MEPFTLLIKPSGSDCNIDCAYCFYKDRPSEFGTGAQRMSEDVLEKLVADFMRLGFAVSGFAWQGGEPTLMGLDFYQRAVELQRKYGKPGQQVSNKLQTNGILLNDKWCRFLHDNKFLLGISIDGPKQFHDYYRRDHSGSGTYDRVMRGIENCKEYGVEFNALVLLNQLNVQHPDELFEFFIENDMTYLQFIPCIEHDPSTHKPADFSITPEQYGDFLCRVFDLWYEYGTDKLNIRDFDSIVTHYVLGRHTVCTHSRQCTGFLVVEHTGECFPCEFFVGPEWRIGNVLETPLGELATHTKRRAFARNKQSVSGKCLICNYLDLCRGSGMKDRIRMDSDSSVSETYFCQAYKRFYDYSLPRFMQISADISAGSVGRHTRSGDRIRLQIEEYGQNDEK